MDAQQELFTKLRSRLVQRFGEQNVFDEGLPPEGTPYPFIYIEESTQNDGNVKAAMVGEVLQTVSVWHDNPKKRGTLSNWCAGIKYEAHRIERTELFGWRCKGVSQEIIHDDTTGKVLMHAVIELTYDYSYGGN